jgi:hypothetical protein
MYLIQTDNIKWKNATYIFSIMVLITSKYTIYRKVCGYPFKWVDLFISATPVADRCIKLSTHPCNLHRQNTIVKWKRLEVLKHICTMFQNLWKQRQHKNCSLGASMAEQPHTSLRSPCAMPSVCWNGNVLWSAESCFTIWQSGQIWICRMPVDANCQL